MGGGGEEEIRQIFPNEYLIITFWFDKQPADVVIYSPEFRLVSRWSAPQSGTETNQVDCRRWCARRRVQRGACIQLRSRKLPSIEVNSEKGTSQKDEEWLRGISRCCERTVVELRLPTKRKKSREATGGRRHRRHRSATALLTFDLARRAPAICIQWWFRFTCAAHLNIRGPWFIYLFSLSLIQGFLDRIGALHRIRISPVDFWNVWNNSVLSDTWCFNGWGKEGRTSG